MAKVQNSLDIVSCQTRFPKALFQFLDTRVQALHRGVRIRMVTEPFSPSDVQVKEIVEAEAKIGAQVRFIDKPPQAMITLFDEKEVFIATSPSGGLESSALWSTNSSLIALARTYFDEVWSNST